MARFLGEYPSKLDEKNRVMLPAVLRKQLPGEARFVLNRALDACIHIYPYTHWQKIDEALDQLSPFVKKERDFVRYMRAGASEINLDSVGRFIVPKRLMSYASIESSVMFLGNGTLIELWDLAQYEAMLDILPEDFSVLAEDIMGKLEEMADEEASRETLASLIMPLSK